MVPPSPERSPVGSLPDGKTIRNNRDLLLLLFVMIRNSKKWWLLPVLLVLAFLSLFVTLTGNQSVLPAIYALF